MSKKDSASLFDQNDSAASLREVITAGGLDGAKVTVALPTDESKRPAIQDRHKVLLYDGKKAAEWTVTSLRELFRGDKKPPADMNHYPEEYVPVFYFIEKHVLTVNAAVGGLRDRDLEELYSNLRRRPDGKSFGPAHDALWQVAAVTLGLRSLSQAEYEELFGQLARSCRHFAMGSTSRNYIEYLEGGIGRAG
jgi:hypothetical protein